MLAKKKLARCYKWANEDYNRLYKIRALGPKAVKILNKDLNFPTPGVSTVDRKYQFFHVPLGLITPAIELLKIKSKIMKGTRKKHLVKMGVQNMFVQFLKRSSVIGNPRVVT